jgi:lambda family phage portal protein
MADKSLIKSVYSSVLDGVADWALSRKLKGGQLVEVPMDGKVEARYDGAFQYWHKRGYIPEAVQDARFDATPGVRLELTRRSRQWEKNSAIIQKLLDLFEEFTVGHSGLQLIPNSSDEDWNETAAAWWREWCQSPGRDNFDPMFQLQSQMARNWFVDGEIFILKTFDPATGRPAIQLIEGHRIATPGSKTMAEGKDIIDGVEIDEAGKPVAYQVRQKDTVSSYGYYQQTPGGQPGLDYSTQIYARVEAENLLHLFEAVRPGIKRGLPMAYAVLNDCQDLYELQDLEMQKARDGAAITTVCTTKTGEAKTDNLFANRWQVSSQNANGTTAIKPIPAYYTIDLGGKTVYVMPGEKIEQFKSDQPSAATQDYWNTLIGKVCIGVGIPRVLVIPYTMQGTVLRADIETAAAYFRARSAVIGHTMHQLYRWAVGWGVDYDRRLKGAPKDWDQIVIRPPRSVNVDIGRNSQALIAEMQNGIRTLADVCNELGLDWRAVLRQRAKEWAYAQQLSDESDGKVPVERIMELPKPPTPPGGGFTPGQNAQAIADAIVEAIEEQAAFNGNGHANGHIPAKRLELQV